MHYPYICTSPSNKSWLELSSCLAYDAVSDRLIGPNGLVLVGYDQEQHHSFNYFDDCEELPYLTLLVPLSLFTSMTLLLKP